MSAFHINVVLIFLLLVAAHAKQIIRSNIDASGVILGSVAFPDFPEPLQGNNLLQAESAWTNRDDQNNCQPGPYRSQLGQPSAAKAYCETDANCGGFLFVSPQAQKARDGRDIASAYFCKKEDFKSSGFGHISAGSAIGYLKNEGSPLPQVEGCDVPKPNKRAWNPSIDWDQSFTATSGQECMARCGLEPTCKAWSWQQQSEYYGTCRRYKVQPASVRDPNSDDLQGGTWSCGQCHQQADPDPVPAPDPTPASAAASARTVIEQHSGKVCHEPRIFGKQSLWQTSPAECESKCAADTECVALAYKKANATSDTSCADYDGQACYMYKVNINGSKCRLGSNKCFDFKAFEEF
mmetsp:Transcript_96254/g.170953  ORF Transcript_96254/g.170953 Transcript_96254/m.170953 type:complete len:351 (-) Transcript_96254:139-1191(-)